MSRFEPCGTCNGWGIFLNVLGAPACPDCNGRGKILDGEYEMRDEIFGPSGWGRDDHGISHLTYTIPQGVERLVRGLAQHLRTLLKTRPMLIPAPFKIGKRNRTEWCIAKHRIGGEYSDETEQEEGGFFVQVELRDFGSEGPAPIKGTWPDRLLHQLYPLLPLERLVMLACYTPEGYYIGGLDQALVVYGAWKLTDVQPIAVAVGTCEGESLSTEEVVERKLTCQIGFDPKGEKWVGWSHRAASEFGIGYVAEEGYCETTSGWSDEYLAANPKDDLSVPVGFEVKTLADAKRCAIAFAESVG